MILDRNLVICVALVALSTSLLFIYFTRKTKEMEDKMSSLFQLIQDYATGDDDDEEYVQVSKQNAGMIQVSDGEGDYEVDDVDDEVEEGFKNDEYSDEDEVENEEDEENTDFVNNMNASVQNIQSVSQELTTDDLEKKGTVSMNDNDSLEDVDIDIDDIDEMEQTTKNVEVNEELELSKMKVSELKQMCSDKGLSGYSGLKKDELVQLLSS